MNQLKQRVLTGTRSSGKPHLGNYFGAYKPAIDLQKSYELFFFIADFHALNGSETAEQMTEYSYDLVATMMACGLDVERSCFYAQSGVPEVCQLAWILGCQSPYGLLLRAHSFKDAQAKGVEINSGVFNYPVLMAADILLYDAALVPVGQDQKQHLEMARDIAGRFNHRYGEVFALPKPLISDEVAVIPGLDGEKMSKSKGNVIPIFASDKEWKKAVMAIESDSKGLDEAKDPDSSVIFKLFKLLASKDEVDQMAHNYRSGGYGYGHAKQELLDKIKKTFSEPRDKYLEIVQNKNYLRDIIYEGSARAKIIADAKLDEVFEAVGVIGRRKSR